MHCNKYSLDFKGHDLDFFFDLQPNAEQLSTILHREADADKTQRECPLTFSEKLYVINTCLHMLLHVYLQRSKQKQTISLDCILSCTM